MPDILSLPYVQRGLLEVGVLSLGAGLIGTWIVLRGLAFYSHAAGTAAFPGLVLADGLGFAGPIGALGAAAVFAVALLSISRSGSRDLGERGGEVALVLVGMLALGVILASDVFHSTTGVETLLFGSLLLIDPVDVVIAAAISVIALSSSIALGKRWVAVGFDALGGAGTRRARALDLALLLIVALATAAALSALGALLVASMFVVPAACTRPWFAGLRSWQLATVALSVALGSLGVIISVEINAPPGPMIALLGGVAFVLSAIGLRLRSRMGAAPVLLASAAIASALVVGAWSSNPDSGRPVVVATTPVMADLVRQVAGDKVDVEQILSVNSDPHEYEPRPDDINKLASAAVVFASGGEIDAWIADAVEQSGSDGQLVVLSNSIKDRVPSSDAGSGGLDPHWWHDPRNVENVTATIASSISSDDPNDRSYFARSARRFKGRVADLDRRLEACYDSVRKARRKIVTDHDAFGYLAHRYGIEIVGTVIPALTTEAQPSAGELSDLRRVIKREHVKAIFPETSVNANLAKTIASETRASAEYTLYGDSLGPPGSSGATYLQMEQANADSILRGMTGGVRGCPAR